MKISTYALALLMLAPVSVSASELPFFTSGGTVLVATSSSANVYTAGGSVVAAASIRGDISAAGGSLSINAPVAGDVLLAGGSITLAAPTSGDARLLGGSISITQPVGGDLVAFGGSVIDSGGGGASTFIVAGEASITNGATGPVVIFGNTVSLGGVFAGDVEVTAVGRVSLLPDTVIRGELRYQAPQEASIPTSANILGGVHYTGASYLPTSEEAQAIALASFGVFLLVKILGVLILAGLFAGLFPSFANHIVIGATKVSVRRAFLTLALGFAILVATPLLLVLLGVTFVGLGLAVLLGLMYLLLIPIAFISIAIVIGSYLARLIFKRSELRWSDAILGMLILYLIWGVPLIGGFITALAVMYMAGVLVLLSYRFAFPRETEFA